MKTFGIISSKKCHKLTKYMSRNLLLTIKFLHTGQATSTEVSTTSVTTTSAGTTTAGPTSTEQTTTTVVTSSPEATTTEITTVEITSGQYKRMVLSFTVFKTFLRGVFQTNC